MVPSTVRGASNRIGCGTAALTEASAFTSAIAYCTPSQSGGAILTAPPALNANALLAACSVVIVLVSPPLDGRVVCSVNVLVAVRTPAFADTSTRGCDWACAAAGATFRVVM